ncbi:entericidin A/B family lipoprotein [bacterium]|nr:entericidin A/B family lipoprotein [bacterium]
MYHWIQRISTFCLLFFLLIGLLGCNTIAGAGKDIEAAGEALEQSASDAK